MTKSLATLTFGLIMLGTAFADEPVCRVQSIVRADSSGSAKLVQHRPTDQNPAGYPVTVNCAGYIKDRYATDANTVATLEFLIGGRVGINKDTEVEVVDERSVSDKNTQVKRFKLKKGALMVKADAGSLKQPIEIQTNGGVMGIKGTEFTVEQNADGSSRVCCFESNSQQGGVEMRDNNGKVVGNVKPGDEYLTTMKGVETKHYDDIPKFREERTQQIFGDFARAITNGLNWINTGVGLANTFGANISLGGAAAPLARVQQATYFASSVYDLQNADFERDPVGSASRINSAVNSAGYGDSRVSSGLGALGSFGIGGGGERKAEKPNFPSQLAPDATPNSNKPPQAPQFPNFTWQGVDDADGYVVLVGKDEKMNEIVFSDRTQAPSLAYPTSMRPLEKGQKYYWRVIPVNDEDKPVQKASAAFFTVS